MLARLSARFNQYHERWLRKRIPASNRYTLHLKNVFIFPTRFGFGYLLTCISLFLLGTNYQNNLMLLLCQFLLAVFLLHLFISYRNFTATTLSLKPIAPVTAGEHALLTVQLEDKHPQQPFYGGLHMQLRGTSLSLLNRRADQEKQLKLLLPTRVRGIFNLPRITFSSTYPLGLFRCWTHLDFEQQLIVYPAPVPSSLRLDSADTTQGDTSGPTPGIDEFDSLRHFRPGDPMNRVAWKQAAKGGDLATKTFTQSRQESGWLSLAMYQDEPLEKALGLLSYQVNRLIGQQQTFGLRLGEQIVEPGSGEQHKLQCLGQLAQYRTTDQPYAAD